MSGQPWGDDEVLALRYDEPALAGELARWCGGHVERTPAGDDVVTTLVVPTARGPRTARLGDWIAMHEPGDFHVFTPEDFAARHSPA